MTLPIALYKRRVGIQLCFVVFLNTR